MSAAEHENLQPYRAKTKGWIDVLAAFLCERTPDGRHYEVSDVRRAMQGSDKQTPPFDVDYNGYQCRQIDLLRAGRVI